MHSGAFPRSRVRNTEYCIGFSTAITRAMDAIERRRTTDNNFHFHPTVLRATFVLVFSSIQRKARHSLISEAQK